MRRSGPEWGNSFHPSGSASGKKDRVGITALLKCIQCGAYNNANRTTWSEQGTGITEGMSNGVPDPVNEAGCYHCGATYWRRSKPQHIREDELVHDPEIVRKVNRRR